MASILQRIFGGKSVAPTKKPQRPTRAAPYDAYPWVVRDADIIRPPLQPTPPPYTQYIARPPIVDRYPIIIGQQLSGQQLSQVYRLCTTGWRYQFVDCMNELMEHDAHARGVFRQRILNVAGGRTEVHPAKLRQDHPKADIAKEAADRLAEQVDAVPRLQQAIAQLEWAVFYGLAGAEADWAVSKEEGWEVTGLSNVHSRRLNYPDPSTWDLYIYDQGLVGPGLSAFGPTTGLFGLRVADYPGKFIIHSPALNADYPTRDGEARYVGFVMLLKRMVVRSTAQDFERVIRPWVIGYFNRDADENGKPPAATPDDQTALDNALQALGMGSLNATSLPNTVKVELLKAAAAMSATEFIGYLNRELSKAALGQAFTTEPGANGNYGTAETASKETLKLARYDGRCLADSLEDGWARPWFRLNYPNENIRLAPRFQIVVDETVPKEVADLITKATACNVPVDADWAGEQLGMKVVAKDNLETRRTRLMAASKEGEQAPGQEGEPTADGEMTEDGAEEGGGEDPADSSESEDVEAGDEDAGEEPNDVDEELDAADEELDSLQAELDAIDLEDEDASDDAEA